MKKSMIILAVLFSNVFAADDKPAPFTVLSYNTQSNNNLIWDGYGFKTKEQVKLRYTPLKIRQRIIKAEEMFEKAASGRPRRGSRGARQPGYYTVNNQHGHSKYAPGLYYHEGYVFSHIELSRIKPYKDIIKQAMPVKSSEITVLQHVGDTQLRIKISGGDNNAILTLSENHPFLLHADDKVFSMPIKSAGLLQYRSTLDGNVTVNSYADASGDLETEAVEVDPEAISDEETVMAAYNVGIAKDFWKGMINSNKSCLKCFGKGTIKCKLCDKGRLKYTVDKKTVKRLCLIGCRKGDRCCPDCVLVNVPTYNASSAEKYNERLNLYKAKLAERKPAN